MNSPFDPADADALIAPRDLFAGGWEALDGGTSVTWNHAVRTNLALEIAHQLAAEIPDLVLKGGTPIDTGVSAGRMHARVAGIVRALASMTSEKSEEETSSGTFPVCETWATSAS